MHTARKSFRSVSPLGYSAACDHATNPPFRSMASQQPEPVQSSDPPQPTVPKLESCSVSGATGAIRNPPDGVMVKPKKEKKPVSISGFKATSSVSMPPVKKPVLPASSLIYQDADVGVDLGSTRRGAGHGAGFIKPADVDTPPQPSQPPQKPAVLSVVENAGAQVEKKKRTIDASDSSPHPTDAPEGSSRKKRKG